MWDTPSLLDYFSQALSLSWAATVPPFPQQVTKAQPGEIALVRAKGSKQRSRLFGARGVWLWQFRTPGRNAIGTPESPLKQIKDILNREQGEKRLNKAGLKPEHRLLLSLEREKESSRTQMKKRRDGCDLPRGSKCGSLRWISSRANQRQRSLGADWFVFIHALPVKFTLITKYPFHLDF